MIYLQFVQVYLRHWRKVIIIRDGLLCLVSIFKAIVLIDIFIIGHSATRFFVECFRSAFKILFEIGHSTIRHILCGTIGPISLNILTILVRISRILTTVDSQLIYTLHFARFGTLQYQALCRSLVYIHQPTEVNTIGSATIIAILHYIAVKHRFDGSFRAIRNGGFVIVYYPLDSCFISLCYKEQVIPKADICNNKEKFSIIFYYRKIRLQKVLCCFFSRISLALCNVLKCKRIHSRQHRLHRIRLIAGLDVLTLPIRFRDGARTQPQRHHQRQQQTDQFFHHTFLSFPAKRVRFSPLKR